METQAVFDSWRNQVGAATFPASEALFSVNDRGAVGDGATSATCAIQQAVDDAAANGGGCVTFDPGIYLTGTIHLRSGVRLDIPRGVTLAGSENIADYPFMRTRHAGIELDTVSPLILIQNCRCAAVTGCGTIDGRGKVWWDLFWNRMLPEYEAKKLRWCVDYDCHRPKALCIQNSEDVTVRGVVFLRSAHWTVHILYSSRVTVDDIIVRNEIGGHGPSTDGIDIDSSEYVHVRHSDISCNDDNFCFKSGRDADGLRVNRPTRFVLVENCRTSSGRGMATVGSETSGGFEHIVVRDMLCCGTANGIRFKSTATRGGFIRDIWFDRIEMRHPGTAIRMDFNWFPAYGDCHLPEEYRNRPHPGHWDTLLRPVEPPERGIPRIEDIRFSNLRCENAQRCLDLAGSAAIIPRNLLFENVVLQGEQAGTIDFVRDVQPQRFIVAAKTAPEVRHADLRAEPIGENVFSLHPKTE